MQPRSSLLTNKIRLQIVPGAPASPLRPNDDKGWAVENLELAAQRFRPL